MIAPIANLFGYVLNILYNVIQNYGIAIILFSIIIKLLLLPTSIKQQKTMAKSTEVQKKLKEIQDKYKNDQEKLAKETMNLYKEEKMSPFSGCLSPIIQILIMLAMFYLVSSPLTYMKKLDKEIIEDYKTQIAEEGIEASSYQEIAIIRAKGQDNENVRINMELLGLDLSSVPKDQLGDFRVYIIPVLYVISSFGSMAIMNSMQKKTTQNSNNEQMEAIQSMNKSMMYMMPIMSVSISMIAPLGLGLYWLINNLLMIVERLCVNKFFVENKEVEKNA